MKKTMLFLLLAFCFSNSVQAGQDAVSIKLISFNMRTSWGRDGDNSWPNRRHATAQMLRQEAPDVMGVQEAMQDQLYYIDTECPRYARVGEDRDGGAEGGETMAVFYLRDRFELLDSGTFYMSNIELLIGQSSTEAERKRAARLQNKALSAPRTNGGHLSDIRPPEIEIELEKEIEIKREIEKGRSARAYGRYQNVFLTDEELADLQASFPTVWGQYIEKLSEYMASTGKRYQSHAATIRRWAGEDAKKAAPPTRNRDYSVKEDETV